MGQNEPWNLVKRIERSGVIAWGLKMSIENLVKRIERNLQVMPP
jgi:hypothetical protein